MPRSGTFNLAGHVAVAPYLNEPIPVPSPEDHPVVQGWMCPPVQTFLDGVRSWWRRLASHQWRAGRSDNCLGSLDQTLDEICHLPLEQYRTCRPVSGISKSCACAGLPALSVENGTDPERNRQNASIASTVRSARRKRCEAAARPLRGRK